MPKYNKDSKVQNKPYARSARLNDNNKKKSSLDVKKKPITKSEKVKNADLTSQLDNLMDDLSSQLSPPKKNKQGKKLSEQDKASVNASPFSFNPNLFVLLYRSWNNAGWKKSNDNTNKPKTTWMMLWAS